MRIRSWAAIACLAVCCAARVEAAAIVSTFSGLSGADTVATALQSGDTLFVDGVVRGSTGALSREVTFQVAAGVTRLDGAFAWQAAALPEPRLVGVNVDLLDSNGNLVASDTFAGLRDRFALSSFSQPLDAGAYTLRATGVALGDVSFDLSLTATGDAPSSPTPATPSGSLSSFASHFGERTLFGNLLAANRTGPVDASIDFRLDAPSELSGGAAWAVTPDGPRLIGVNIDVVDMNGIVRASDAFLGLDSGFAVSTFDPFVLEPGDYRLVATGIAAQALASLDVSLVSSEPISMRDGSTVPEPPILVLVMLGLVAAATARRSAGARRPPSP